MDQFITESAINLGVELAKLAVKGTASAVAKKVAVLKSEKNAENLRNIYDEIVNELIQERDEAVRIAQSYKSELERVVISDDDIKHLYATISRVLDILRGMTPPADDEEEGVDPYEMFEPVKELINMDTLKTMQLLGFNYKQAIGEPLTKLCADKISSLGERPSGKNQQGRKR
jgi:hypothetical protein